MIPRLLYLCPLLGFPLLLSAAERAALVIGVNSYSAFPADKQLSSPINDAQDVAQRLAAMGFVVRAPVLDGTRQAIMDAKRHFIDEARGAKVALFYFSGHGFQVGDENYLIPSDMPAISSFTVLRENSIQLRDSVMAGLEEAGAGTKVVILDCCRDNPFAGQIAAALGTKSLRTKGGGGEISGYGPGFFLAFASSPGATALDGNGARNSPFTAALIRHLDEEPGANLRDLFDSVKSTVSEVHGQEQVPWVNDSLNRQHVKVLAKIAPSINTPTPPAMSEAEIEKRARQLAAKMAAETSQSSSDTGGPFTNSLGMKFVSVPGTQVRMCIHETRNADYAAYAAAQNGVDDAWRDHLVGDKEYHPVVNVSHEDAEAFCRWLSAKEAKNYRLPTDAEWSVAVGLASEKGRTPREKDESGQDAFPWGRHWPPRPADGNYQISGVNDGHAGTAPVMSFPPNELGLHDLGGNGMEWCQDWTDDSRVFRVQRGGSWRDDSRDSVRASTRSYGRPVERMDFQSFRIVRVDDATGASAGAQTPQSVSKSMVNTLGMKLVPVPGTEVLMCIHETRNADYAAYAVDQRGLGEEWRKEATGGKEQHPVVSIRYEDAEAFCQWLSAKEGKSYRLPTDEEWSAAALKTEFPWGSHFPPGNQDGNYVKGITTDGYDGTAPVMSFRANKLGIHDLGGNVWEWCSTWYSASLNDEDVRRMNPALNFEGDGGIKSFRVLRGGAWNSTEKYQMLSSYRDRGTPGYLYGNHGFRIVLVAPEN